jgi:chemotaxis methyl-accepting protein methylase
MSTTTRFFRNMPQLLTVAETVGSTWPAGRTLDVLHVGGSVGCEALSFMITMKGHAPRFHVRAVSSDVDVRALAYGRALAYEETLFEPLLGEGGGRPDLMAKWFSAIGDPAGRRYAPVPSLSRDLRFAHFDLTAPEPGFTADVVFCQNVLIHMSRPLAQRSVRTLLGLMRSPGILVCGGMDLDLRGALQAAGLRPVPHRVREIHDAWASHRFHFQHDRGRYYFELEDVDETRPDWIGRYSSVFVRERSCG